MSDAHDRLSALERQVADLTARLEAAQAAPAPLAPAPPVDRPAPQPDAGYDRRALLRRSGAVLATAAGAAVLSARPVAAATGDPVLAGRAVDAPGATTSLTGGTASEPALAVANPASRTADGGAYAGPALRLAPAAGADLGLDPQSSAAGDLTSSGDYLWYAHVREADSTVVGAVYTSAFANHLEPVTPRRVLDTRRGLPGLEGGAPNDGRSRVAAGRFDTAGRLEAGSALVLDLSGLLLGEQAGVLGNLTVVGPQASGFLAAYPTPDGSLDTSGAGRPAVSSLNFARGATVANFAFVPFEAGNRISVYTTTAAHVLFDVSAFSVFDPFSTTEPGSARTGGTGWRGR